MKNAAIICEDPKLFDHVFSAGRKEELACAVNLHPVILNSKNLEREAPRLKHVEALFSTWGMPALSGERLESSLPSVKALFYAAGTVKGFATPFLERGVIVVSAWRANAIPVAEFVCAQVTLSCKGYFRNRLDAGDPERRVAGECHQGKGVFGEKVGLVGCGMIARHLIKLLKSYRLQVMVCDPYLSDAAAAELGVEKAELARLFSECYVVSNHLPNLESLRGVLNGELFRSMRQGATFINTGRGAQVNETELVDVFSRRPDLTALLDVTDPEPPPVGSPLYAAPNIHLSSHIAGSLGDEVVRMADYVLDDFRNWEAGRPLEHSVSLATLATMA